ncbi:MAG: transcriptional regulator [Gammaproteobacteria bacterium]|nr:MAG: transcriptional regulator [Gammaproteobacteria bacterium]
MKRGGDVPETKFTIGKLSKRTNVHIETIRYYERIELLPKPARTVGGQRIYAVDDVRRLVFIRRSRELGFSLQEIRNLLALVDGGDATCAEVKDLTIRHLIDVQDKIADLRKLEGVLQDMAAKCEGGEVPECPVIEALSEETENTAVKV